ncbi:hypothetical protein NA56DRAFT_193831 [Hyaloscypha hepaticicola]|uniref:DUF7907 domain-containing protein n=1 Tax=Hyaloscypha hepaticicola TaxID=2082293 RepID=A0A2J6PZW8_9HELO|nr:hypothetical protein NA56DRAFT_193831 [Hyaloscypha hepaticicola]
MTALLKLALAASTIFGVASSLPADIAVRQTWVPGTQNNTQEFYISTAVINGLKTYDGWEVVTFHTGAGLADPVFAPAPGGSRAFLYGMNLQFDVYQGPFSLTAYSFDTNEARWAPTAISTGSGLSSFYNNGMNGIQVNNLLHDGWIVCEWYHYNN